jgi:hypothetical protein
MSLRILKASDFACFGLMPASSILSTHNFTKEEHKTLICTMRGKSQIATLPNTPDELDTFGSESSELISFSLVCLCSLQGDSMYREDLMVSNHHIKRSGSRKFFEALGGQGDKGTMEVFLPEHQLAIL